MRIAPDASRRPAARPVSFSPAPNTGAAAPAAPPGVPLPRLPAAPLAGFPLDPLLALAVAVDSRGCDP